MGRGAEPHRFSSGIRSTTPIRSKDFPMPEKTPAATAAESAGSAAFGSLKRAVQNRLLLPLLLVLPRPNMERPSAKCAGLEQD